MRERRYQAISINPNVLMHCFTTTCSEGAEWYERMIFPSLPEDYEVVSVNYDHCRQAFYIVIYHESFPVVPDYQIIPDVQVEYKTVKINKFRIPSEKLPAPSLVTKTDPTVENQVIAGFQFGLHDIKSNSYGTRVNSIIAGPNKRYEFERPLDVLPWQSLRLDANRISKIDTFGKVIDSTAVSRVATLTEGPIYGEGWLPCYEVEVIDGRTTEVPSNPFEKTWRDKELML